MLRPNRMATGVRRRGFTMIEIMIVLAVISIIALIAIPNLLASKTSANEAACIANLKALSTAQFQFQKKNGYYAPSCAVLGTLNLVPPDLPKAFDSFHDNGDVRVSPKSGYYFRVLHGDGTGATCWWQNNLTGADAQMISFGFTSRTAEPYSTGEFQYYIGEQGAIYKQAEAKQDDPRYRLYFLDALPPSPPLTWKPSK